MYIIKKIKVFFLKHSSKVKKLLKLINKNISKIVPVNLAEGSIDNAFDTKKKYFPTNSINLIFQIENRLNQVKDSIGANRYLHYRWLMIFDETLNLISKHKLLLPDNFNYLSFGAGARNTFALSFLFYLAGAKKCYIIEPDKLVDFSVYYGLKEMIYRYCIGDITSKHFKQHNNIKSLLNNFINYKNFLTNPDPSTFLNNKNIIFYNNYFEDINIPENSIDLLSSRSVLEHVSHYEKCLDKFEKIMKKDGIMYHEIGFGAHGAHSRFDPFSIYYENKDKKNNTRNTVTLNELRINDFINEFTKRNFKCIVAKKVVHKDYALDRPRIKERFQKYSDEDLLCETATIICIKQ